MSILWMITYNDLLSPKAICQRERERERERGVISEVLLFVGHFQVEEKFGELRDFLTGKPYTHHLVTPFFAVENSLDGDEEVGFFSLDGFLCHSCVCVVFC